MATKKPQTGEKRVPLPPGPEPDRVKIEGDWGEAVKKALAKKKPAEGWPAEDWKKPKNG